MIVENEEKMFASIKTRYLRPGFYGKVVISVFDGNVNHVEVQQSINLFEFCDKPKDVTNEE